MSEPAVAATGRTPEGSELGGITVLRSARGTERVTFDEIADHLQDFSRRYPHAVHVVDDLARFLARLERVPHRHEPHPDPSNTTGAGTTSKVGGARLRVGRS